MFKMEPCMSNSMMYFLKNEKSEKLRNKHKKQKLWEKLNNGVQKSEKVNKIKNLIEDDRNMTNTIYPVELSANGVSIDYDQQTDKNSAENFSNRSIEDLQISILVSDSIMSSSVLNNQSNQNRDNMLENDFQKKFKPEETRNYNKIVEEENNDINEEKCSTGVELEKVVSKTSNQINHSIAVQPTKSPCLATFEILKQTQSTLEKWIDQIGILNVINEMEMLDSKYTSCGTDFTRPLQGNKNVGFKIEVSKLSLFVSKILEQTVQELQLFKAFVTLQQTNDSTLNTINNENELQEECFSNRNVLNVLKNKKKRFKQRNNVIKTNIRWLWE